MNTDAPTETELIAAVRRGERGAVVRLLDYLEPVLRTILYRYNRGGRYREDLLQDIP